MVEYDLHIHTNASDGLWDPEKIINTAKMIGLKGIAITDHDTVESIEKSIALSEKYGVQLIPGVEISAENNGYEIHILGYFINYRCKELLDFLIDIQNQRKNRIVRIINKLSNLGLRINFDEVENEAGSNVKSIGRPHIARVLVKKGYYKEISEVFKYLLNKDKPAYVEKQKISIEDAVDIIKNSGGKPVLAHPFTDTGFVKGCEFETFLNKIVNLGIKGIEVYHTKHSKDDEKYLLKLSKKLNIAAAGGSDFHGISESKGLTLGSKGICESDLNKLKYI